MPLKKISKKLRKALAKQYPPVIGMLFTFFMGLFAFIVIITTAVSVDSDVDGTLLPSMLSEKMLHRTIRELRKPRISYETPETVRGIYATAYTASSPSRINKIINLINTTELNSIVIDIKLDGGWIIFDTGSSIIKEAKTENVLIDDLPLLLQELQANGIYTIARMTAFQDPALVATRPDLAIADKRGGVWKDWKGVTWLDPHSEEVWEYVVAVADAAIDVGFQEINFDYIRFPSDGPLSQINYTHGTGENKVETLNAFFKHLDTKLADEDAKLSVDLFGITLWSDNDFNIGQTLVGAAPHFDYILPMVYPSHYPDGFNGYANPAEFPYEVIAVNLDRGIPRIEGERALLRPWLQDFDLGAVYTPELVRAQIRAAEERNTNGWILWNASNNYTVGALKR